MRGKECIASPSAAFDGGSGPTTTLSQDVKVLYPGVSFWPMEAFTEQSGDYASYIEGFVCP